MVKIIDRAVANEVLSVLRPIGVEAAIHAIEQQSDEGHAKRRQVELARNRDEGAVSRVVRNEGVVGRGQCR